ncbi:MAG: aminotransferase class V-fold PLP-dependent enzyme [Chlamydiae bacterium]|nr:aminotransferase class V-fold PLP-dependent enzyme [Chlamydiota bacterium]
MKEPIYLDHHTVGRPSKETLEIFFRASQDYWGVLSSPHFIGQQQVYPLQKSVNSLYTSLGLSDEDEVFFTGGGPEGILQVFSHVYHTISRQTGKTLLWTGELEDSSIPLSMGIMESLGCLGKRLPVNAKGQIMKDTLASMVTSRSALVSFSWASGLTGVIQPLEDLASVCADKGVLLHVEASHLVGKRFFRFQDLGVHYLTMEGMVLQAPQGTGLLISKGGYTPMPLIPGREEGYAAQSLTLAHVVQERVEQFEMMCMEACRLRDLFEEKLVQKIPKVRVLFQGADRLPNCSCVTFPKVHAESLLYLLHTQGVYATRGKKGIPILESLLQQIGYSQEEACSAVSFSFSLETTEAEVLEAVERIVFSVQSLQKVSSGVVRA